MRKLFSFAVLAFVLTLSTIINAQAVTSVFVAGNPRCADLTPAFNSGTLVQPSSSVLSTGFGTITTNINPSRQTLAWETSAPAFVGAVIVKGGDNANVYFYNPASVGDSGLVSPLTNGGQLPQISHIQYCYTLTINPQTPTAAHVEVAGRVIDANGRPISGARLTLTDVQTGEVVGSGLTNPFGYFTVVGAEAGTNYLLSTTAKGRQFGDRFLNLVDNVTDLEIVAQ